jgi:hypothetical protein
MGLSFFRRYPDIKGWSDSTVIVKLVIGNVFNLSKGHFSYSEMLGAQELTVILPSACQSKQEKSIETTSSGVPTSGEMILS